MTFSFDGGTIKSLKLPFKDKEYSFEFHFGVPIRYPRYEESTADEDFVNLCDQAKSVKITLLGKSVQSAKFTGAEAKEICGGVSPGNANENEIENIRRSVIERKVHPLLEPEIPGGGGKSKDAQGQTRKPGSHKDNTGHK